MIPDRIMKKKVEKEKKGKFEEGIVETLFLSKYLIPHTTMLTTKY